MALPQGAYSPGTSGVAQSTGAYSYLAGIVVPQYFAGTFFIDTLHDDPVGYTAGADPAEVYAARVYIKTSTYSPTQTTGTGIGMWMVSATPVWAVQHYAGNSGTLQTRIYIKCDVYVTSPPSKTDGSWYRADSCDWSLYRV